jgi:peptidyl-prolyl cis-trans isomerase B (cyclophilin B)
LNFRSADPRGYGYCVFGKVIGGMDVVVKIENSTTGNKGRFQNVPAETITIESVRRK